MIRLNRPELDRLRKAKGIGSEAELARRIGVSVTTLWRISRGEVQPSSTFIARVMVAFPGVRIDRMFSAEVPA